MTDSSSMPTLAVLNALAEPSRLAIVGLLREGPHSVGDIATQIRIAQPHASRHLRILADAGLVSARRDAQSKIYRLERSPFASLESWLASFAPIWEERADRLAGYLERLAETEPETQARAPEERT